MRRILVPIAVATAAVLVAGTPAYADDRLGVDVEATEECGEATITWSNPLTRDHIGGYEVIGVDADDQTEVSIPAGETVTESIEAEDDAEVRAWIGPSSNRADSGTRDDVTEVDLFVTACEDDAEPDPAPIAEPRTTPSSTPSPQDDDPTTPADNDGPADWVSDFDPAPEGTHPGQFCRTDDAYRIYAYTETSVIQCLYNEASDRHHWVEILDPANLAEAPSDEDDDSDQSAENDSREDDDSDDRSAPGATDGQDKGGLPVTGAALGGLVVAAVAAIAGGGVTLWASRRQHGEEE